MKSKLSLARMGMRGSLALITIGILILTAGIFATVNSSKLPDNAAEVTAEITAFLTDNQSEIQSTTTLVSYTVDGTKYDNVILRQYQASWKVGDKIDICCSRDDPTHIWTKTMEYSGFLFMLLSAPFLLIGSYKIVQFARVRIRNNRLVLEDEPEGSDDDEYDDEDEMTTEEGFKFRISTIIIPFAAVVPFTILGMILIAVDAAPFISVLVTTLGLLALFAGMIALGNFIRKKSKYKKQMDKIINFK